MNKHENYINEIINKESEIYNIRRLLALKSSWLIYVNNSTKTANIHDDITKSHTNNKIIPPKKILFHKKCLLEGKIFYIALKKLILNKIKFLILKRTNYMKIHCASNSKLIINLIIFIDYSNY